MNIHIGMILSTPSKQYIEQFLPELEAICDITLLEARSLPEAKSLFLSCAKNYHAIIFSGILLMLYSTENTSVDVVCFSLEETSHDLQGLLYRIILENRNIDFSRVSIDLTTSHLKETRLLELFPENQMPYTLKDDLISEFSFDFKNAKNPQLLDQMLSWHLDLFRQGKTDLIITCIGSLLPELKALDVPYAYLTSSREYVINFVIQIMRCVDTKDEKRQETGAIVLRVKTGEAHSDQHLLLEKCNLSMINFARKNGLDFIFSKSSNALEAIGSYTSLFYITNGFTGLPDITEFPNGIKKSFSIGIGVGSSPFQARLNASNAATFAGIKDQVYYIDAKNKVKELSRNAAESLNLSPISQLITLANQYKVDHLLLQEIIHFVHSSEKNAITSAELANILNVSVRTANRILTKITVNGGAIEYKENLGKSKGRPVSKYELTFLHDLE